MSGEGAATRRLHNGKRIIINSLISYRDRDDFWTCKPKITNSHGYIEVLKRNTRVPVDRGVFFRKRKVSSSTFRVRQSPQG